MIVGIVGLGLIGGSFAKAYHQAGHTVLAHDLDESMLDFAAMTGDINGRLTMKNISDCDLVLICIFPEAAVEYLRAAAPHIGKKPFVIDCCGTKKTVCDAAFTIAREYGFTFMGGHPMAGTHNSGYKHAKENMFKGAPMVLVPADRDDIALIDRAQSLLRPVGFGRFSVTTAEKHDEMIAFTSQMAHIVSNAYIKSPTASRHKGFSAGSYKDLTRVAWLNPYMWAELFRENRDNLIYELDFFIESLQKYRKALEENDTELMIELLDEGKRRKEEVDGR